MIRATASHVFVVRAGGSESPSPTTNSTVGSPPYWTETESVLLAVALGIIMFVAVIGNILVITVVAKNRGMRTRTNIFLCNLALADLFCALLDMPLSLVTIVKGDWIFSQTLCQFNGFAVPFFFVASIHTLMYIGIHKYISIRYPLGQVLTRRRVRMMIGSAWLWAAIAGYLTLHGLNTVTYKPKTAQCGPAYPSNPWTYSHLGFMVITCYLVPLIILALCYVGMFREIQALSARMEQHTTMEKQLIYVQQRRISLTLLIVLVFFGICWTPHIVYSVSVSVIVDKAQMPRLANPISYWCGYLSSACNPLIYGLMSPAFREGYKELLCSVHQEEIVSDGYSYYRRKRRPWSTITVSSNYYSKAYQPNGIQPFSQFRHFLTQHFGGVFSDPDSSESAPASRKNSFSSIANYILFPKSRAVSTNSLPRNFSYSTSLPGRLPPNGVASRLQHVLNATNARFQRRNMSPVYYPTPDTGILKTPDIEIHIDDVDDDEIPVRKQSFAFDAAPLISVNEVSNEMDSLTVTAEIEPSPKGIMKTPRSSVSSDHHRHSIESGFNDCVFLSANQDNGVRRVSQPVSARRDSLFGDMLTVPEETRQWFSKSLSEEGKKTPPDEFSIDKATSDTCILCKKERKGTKAGVPARGRLSIFRRLFSRNGPDGEHHKRKITIGGESVSSVDDSPATERKASTGILKKYFRSVSADPTRSQYPKNSDSRQLSFSTDIPRRSASDPSLLGRKLSRWKRMVDKYKKKHRRPSGEGMKSHRSESSSIGRLFRSISERPAEIEKHPSIEKLDTMNQESLFFSYTGANYNPKQKFHERRSVSHEYVKRDHITPEVSHAEPETEDGKVMVYMYRSASDPNMTFHMIEEKVLQRRETKRWDRERKSSFRRSSEAPVPSDSTDDTAIDVDSGDELNMNNSAIPCQHPTTFLVVPDVCEYGIDRETVL